MSGVSGGKATTSKTTLAVETIASLKASSWLSLPPLIRLAQRLDKQTISGAEVIALQAVEQFAMYTGVRPDAQLIAEAAQFAREG
ncbi:hypothetical protein AWE92_21085 [Escherichia coli]|nr:hypothetical protein AWE92_21085 [Escherichia coli]KUW40595.1 hypothetical protein AWF65_23750 [Escherichia coli]